MVVAINVIYLVRHIVQGGCFLYHANPAAAGVFRHPSPAGGGGRQTSQSITREPMAAATGEAADESLRQDASDEHLKFQF